MSKRITCLLIAGLSFLISMTTLAQPKPLTVLEKTLGVSVEAAYNVAQQTVETDKVVELSMEAGEVTEPITKEDKPYLSLGANLSLGQRETVLKLLGINPEELAEYDVIYTTIDEEYQYLGNYLPAEKMGKKSLSSVLVVKREKGHGISITTKNISYCTIGMYKNALITAGISDADILVAAPFPISGTGALVGVMKVYGVLTGEAVSEESIDTALDELILTGSLAESLGESQQAEELIAYLKQQILELELDSEAEVHRAVVEAGKDFGITLEEKEIEEVTRLLLKIGRLDLQAEDLAVQAKDIYERISEIGSTGGFFDRLWEFFQSIFDYIKELFQ